MSLTPCQVCDCPVIDGEVCHECGERIQSMRAQPFLICIHCWERIPQAEVDEHTGPCAELHGEDELWLVRERAPEP